VGRLDTVFVWNFRGCYEDLVYIRTNMDNAEDATYFEPGVQGAAPGDFE